MAGADVGPAGKPYEPWLPSTWNGVPGTDKIFNAIWTSGVGWVARDALGFLVGG